MAHPGKSLVDTIRAKLNDSRNQRLHGYTVIGELFAYGRVVDRNGHDVNSDTLAIYYEFFIAPSYYLDPIQISSKADGPASTLAGKCVVFDDGSVPFDSVPVVTKGHARFFHHTYVEGEKTEIFYEGDTIIGRLTTDSVTIEVTVILSVCPDERLGNIMFKRRRGELAAESVPFELSE